MWEHQGVVQEPLLTRHSQGQEYQSFPVWWIFLPGFGPRCFPRGLSQIYPLEAARINGLEERFPTRGCRAKPCVFIRGYPRFHSHTPAHLLSPPGGTKIHGKSPFLVKIPNPKAPGQGQKCLSPCLVSLPGDTTSAWPVGVSIPCSTSGTFP